MAKYGIFTRRRRAHPQPPPFDAETNLRYLANSAKIDASQHTKLVGVIPTAADDENDLSDKDNEDADLDFLR